MRWTREQRELLSKFADTLKTTPPRSNGRVEWRQSLYTAWEERWPLDSEVKKAMTEFFRDAMGSASVQQNTKDIKGSHSKKSSKAKVTKNGRSLTAGSSKTTGTTLDLSDAISSSVSTPNYRCKRNGDNAQEATPETRTVPQPSSGINPEAQPVPQPSPLGEITTSTPAPEAGLVPQMGSSHDSNAMTTTDSIKPYQQVGDRPGVHEPIVYESTSNTTVEFVVVLPGIHADGVAVTLANGALNIVVENAVVKINEGPVVTEHKTVRLEYKKMLAKGIQAEDIHVWMKNGLLTVTCPVKDTTPCPIKIFTSPRSPH
ncbi:hypothetical protein PLEOSDRAFT_1102605 [Pleurotus ostreatus PC15]|uniref:SHSP domain-containing protein n=1 Tax=Pleurotus ostreatus (strain PC15) TaxID=1137138 RepID=A0A067NKE7_PLEO1|nr:hypothetical protein PLEOSDRAFT_1102605 [Pleurotus ostreatus PC15]